MTIKRIVIILLAVFAAFLLQGCNVLSPIKDDTQVEMISKLPADLPRQPAHAATLLILPVAASPVYDTVRMAYTDKPYQVAYFSKHEWGATPAQMLQPLLETTMEHTGYFSAVVVPTYSGSYDYALKTEILELVQDFTATPAVLRLSLREQLIDGRSNRSISIREITLSEPMQDKTPYAGVVAANEATAKALQQTAGFVLDSLK
jgi:cholesterol transport system auxiliary component